MRSQRLVELSTIFNGSTGGNGSNATVQDGTALLLKQPFGPALMIIVGLIALGVACYLFYTAYAARFQVKLNKSNVACPSEAIDSLLSAGLGYAALGVVISIIGIFLIVAAFQHNASKAKGLDGALQELAHQPSVGCCWVSSHLGCLPIASTL